MLREERFLLHERLIYVGDSPDKVALVYVPTELPEVPPLGLQFAALIDFLQRQIGSADGDAMQLNSLKQLCKSERWSLYELTRQLHALQRQQMKIYLKQPEQRFAGADWPYHSGHIEEVSVSDDEETAAKSAKPNWSMESMQTDEDGLHAAESTSVTPLEYPQKLVKGLLYTLIVLLVGAWLQTAAEPSTGWTYIACGTTFLAAAYVVFTLPQVQAMLFKKAAKQKDEDDDPDDAWFSSFRLPERGIAETGACAGREKPETDAHDSGSDMESYYRQLAGRTTLLQATGLSMATVVLGATDLQHAAVHQKPRPVLVLPGTANDEYIAIDAFPFLVGREAARANLVLSAPDVSRLHAEITEADERYAVRDLNAKNGTMLNGVPLTPYEVYPLADEDVIGIGAMQLKFRLSHETEGKAGESKAR